jgi:hypothetical protein
VICISARRRICVLPASTICSGHPSIAAASDIFSMTRLPFFSFASAVSLRQVDIALSAAFTASRASFVNSGNAMGLNSRGSPSRNLLGMAAPH